MPEKKEVPVPAIVQSEDGQYVHYGYEYGGAFHPFGSERVGDYEERIEAAKDKGD